MTTLSYHQPRTMRFCRLLTLGILITLFGLPDARMAQSVGLEEIVVTAGIRGENLQQIPESITVLSASTVESAGPNSVDDVTLLVPDLSIVNSQNVGNNLITLRRTAQVRFGEPPMAFVVDGVQSASPSNFTQGLLDVERIEILRGSRRAVYGRNAIGGALNITTKQPTNEFEHSVSTEVAEGSFRRCCLASFGPILRRQSPLPDRCELLRRRRPDWQCNACRRSRFCGRAECARISA